MLNKVSLLIIFLGMILGTSPIVIQTSYAQGGGNDILIGGIGRDDLTAKEVPSWIKTSMGYWVDGHTSDEEFLNAVEYLANEQIIRVESNTGSFDTEMISMNAQKSSSGNLTGSNFNVDSFFDIMYRTYSIDSFFDVFTEMQERTDSFFDVFFEVDTPRTSECARGQELVYDSATSSWKCASANTVDSFFDVFFDVATESSQNTEDIEELKRKIEALEEKLASIESKMNDSGTDPRY